MEPVLPVVDYEFDVQKCEAGDLDNMTVEEYLAYVRWQSNTMPDYTRADVDTSVYENKQTKYMPDMPVIAKCPLSLLPSSDWESDLLIKFDNLRHHIADIAKSYDKKIPRVYSVPAMKDENSWFLFCFGDKETLQNSIDSLDIDGDHAITDTYEDGAGTTGKVDNYCETIAIALDCDSELLLKKRKLELSIQTGDDKKTFYEFDDSIVTAQEEETAESNAESLQSTTALQDWTKAMAPTTSLILQFDQVLTQRLLAFHIQWLETSEMSEARSRWLYALLARLEKPICQDTVALVRQLYRRCCNLRALCGVRSSVDFSYKSIAHVSSEVAFSHYSGLERGEIDEASTESIPGHLPEDRKKENELFFAENEADSCKNNTLAELNLIIVITGVFFGQGEYFFAEDGRKGDDDDEDEEVVEEEDEEEVK